MTIEKWGEIIDNIKEKFTVEDEGEDVIENIPSSKVKFIEFNSPIGQVRLEFITKPVVLDKQTIGSRRIGSDTTVKYIYSDTEFIHTLKAYKDENGEWAELEREAAGAFSI